MKILYPDSVTKAGPGTFECDPDGKLWVYAITHAALTAKTPYFIILDEYGHVTEALPASGKYGYVGVPDQAWASGALAKLQIGGYCEDMISTELTVAVGNGFTCNTGAVADIAADFSGAAGEFAVCITPATASTTHDVQLCGHMIITI